MKKFFEEFKEFAMRGNVMDMAVGIIIGGAFGKIVTSLVDNIIMPLVGLATGGYDLASLSLKVNETEVKYGLFIQNIVDFLIVAFCIFLMIKAVNKVSKKKKEEEASAEPAPTAEEKLLTEIRDLLAKK